MPFEHAFKLCSLLMAGTAFAGLLLARSLPILLAMPVAIILTLTWLRTMGWRLGASILENISASQASWNALLIGAFVLFLVDVMIISQDLLHAGVHFLVVLLGIKLLTLHHRGDYRHLYAICLMAILASAALTTDVWYVPIFLLYLLTAVWTMLLYHLTSGATQAAGARAGHSSSIPLSFAHITGRLFWLTNGIAVVTFVLTLVIFFLIPRISVGLAQKARGEGLKTSGFSERVDLGMIGSVKEDPQIVMRVELPDHPERGKDRLYLRGAAFDRYDGRSWSISNRARRNLGLIAEGTFIVRSIGNRASTSVSAPLRQDILLEALDTSVLFAAPFAEYLSGEFPGVQVDATAGLHLPFPTSSRLRYSVTSRERQVLPDEQLAPELDYTTAVRDHYLQVPTLSDHVGDLARRVSAQAVSPYEKMLDVYRHLLANYRYSLELDTTASPHPIEDFLFTRRTGYCEHYASAMVILLRTLGIPARLVTGFLATEWNEFGNYYTVRQRDAHAWVEVYFPRAGWVTMDPTPAASAMPSLSRWDSLRRIGESLRLHWDRLFIRYSARDQLAVVYSIRDRGDSVRGVLGRWSASISVSVSRLIANLNVEASPTNPAFFMYLTGLAGGGLILLVVLSRNHWWPRRFSRLPAVPHQQPIVHVYRKMLGVIARHGINVRPSMTPLECIQLVGKNWSEAGPMVTGVITLYCRGRFSGSGLSRDELGQAAEQLRLLKQLSRTFP